MTINRPTNSLGRADELRTFQIHELRSDLGPPCDALRIQCGHRALSGKGLQLANHCLLARQFLDQFITRLILRA